MQLTYIELLITLVLFQNFINFELLSNDLHLTIFIPAITGKIRQSFKI